MNRDWEYIPNYADAELSNDMYDMLMDSEFPWWFNHNQSGVPKPNNIDVPVSSQQYGFSHNMFYENNDGEVGVSPWWDRAQSIVQPLAQYLKKDIALLRVRCGLITNIGGPGVSWPHVDSFQKHKTLLYYVDSSDAPTWFFDEVFNPSIPEPVKFHGVESIMPKRGDAVLFEGWRYHASSYPTNDFKRLTININFVEK